MNTRVLFRCLLAIVLSGAFALVNIVPALADSSNRDEGSLIGSVRNAAGAPVAGAVVGVSGPVRRSTTTDASGRFALRNLPAAYYAVTVVKAGFLPARSTNVAIRRAGPFPAGAARGAIGEFFASNRARGGRR